MNELVSVVVPIYNVEKYLDRCLNSIVNQTYRNLEIILVDDGSPDNCPVLCDQWAERDARIKVVHKQNAGLGMARNTGIDHATGEYIFFFDSDDYVAPVTVEKCVESARKNHAEMVIYGFLRVDAHGSIAFKEIPATEKEVYEGREILEYILPGMLSRDPVSGKKLSLNMSSCGRMLSMDLIRKRNWRFVSEREYISEDFYSLLDLFGDVERMSVLHEAFYYYCDNAGSLTHTFRADRFGLINKCHAGMIQICDRYCYPEIVRDSVDFQYFGSTIGAMKLIVPLEKSFSEKIHLLSKVVKDPYLQGVLSHKRTDIENTGRRIFLYLVKHQLTVPMYILLRMKA